jgi:hypothetical protein
MPKVYDGMMQKYFRSLNESKLRNKSSPLLYDAQTPTKKTQNLKFVDSPLQLKISSDSN